MGKFEIFVIRLILSVLFALLACRVFFKGTPLIKVMGLAAILLGLAYLFEYIRRRGNEEHHGE
jgi:succinate-acetate transporter protein